MAAASPTENKSVPDQSGGDTSLVTYDSADNTHTDPKQQANEMVPNETETKQENDQRDREPDPFGQIFAGPNQTKLPVPELWDVQAHLIRRAREFGYARELTEAMGYRPILFSGALGFSGAAYLSLWFMNIPRESPLFHHLFRRLIHCAEASEDLAQFLVALDPSISSCEKIADGWEVQRSDGGKTHWVGLIAAESLVEHYVKATHLLQWHSVGEEEEAEEEEPREDQSSPLSTRKNLPRLLDM